MHGGRRTARAGSGGERTVQWRSAAGAGLVALMGAWANAQAQDMVCHALTAPGWHTCVGASEAQAVPHEIMIAPRYPKRQYPMVWCVHSPKWRFWEEPREVYVVFRSGDLDRPTGATAIEVAGRYGRNAPMEYRSYPARAEIGSGPQGGYHDTVVKGTDALALLIGVLQGGRRWLWKDGEDVESIGIITGGDAIRSVLRACTPQEG